jgi:16S rRNA (guanine1207-N2)-methyltransferase
MSSSETQALEWFIEQRSKLLDRTGRVLILNALPGTYLSGINLESTDCTQDFKPMADVLGRLGCRVATAPDGEYALVLCFGTMFRETNRRLFATGLAHLAEEGLMVCAMPNATGASRFREELGTLFGIVDSVSKFKCKVFWASKQEGAWDPALLNEWLAAGELHPVAGSNLYTYPGTFSAERIDAGSALLSRHLPPGFAGNGADLGAGYGYLSSEILASSPGVETLHLFEADRKALEAARYNLAEVAGRVGLTFNWHDVRTGVPVQMLDWVVCNPPFHVGQQGDLGLGRAFIEAAADALRPGGILYLVANSHLPYEQTLQSRFSSTQLLATEHGYKVYRSIR